MNKHLRQLQQNCIPRLQADRVFVQLSDGKHVLIRPSIQGKRTKGKFQILFSDIYENLYLIQLH